MREVVFVDATVFPATPGTSSDPPGTFASGSFGKEVVAAKGSAVAHATITSIDCTF